MKEKLFGKSKRKVGIIAVCAAMVLTLGVTSAFAASVATQGAKMVKGGEVPAKKNITSDNKTTTGLVKNKNGEVPAGAIKIKDGAPAGQQIKDGEVPAGQSILRRNSPADQQIIR